MLISDTCLLTCSSLDSFKYQVMGSVQHASPCCEAIASCQNIIKILCSFERIYQAICLHVGQVVGEGRCPIVDTWWQTETGAHMITPLPGATTLKPGSATLPFFGVEPAVLNEKGEEMQGECEGYASGLFCAEHSPWQV